MSSNLVTTIFDTVGETVTHFAGTLGNSMTSIAGLFYNSTDGLTFLGTLSLIGLGMGLVIGAYHAIKSLMVRH